MNDSLGSIHSSTPTHQRTPIKHGNGGSLPSTPDSSAVVARRALNTGGAGGDSSFGGASFGSMSGFENAELARELDDEVGVQEEVPGDNERYFLKKIGPLAITPSRAATTMGAILGIVSVVGAVWLTKRTQSLEKFLTESAIICTAGVIFGVWRAHRHSPWMERPRFPLDLSREHAANLLDMVSVLQALWRNEGNSNIEEDEEAKSDELQRDKEEYFRQMYLLLRQTASATERVWVSGVAFGAAAHTINRYVLPNIAPLSQQVMTFGQQLLDQWNSSS